MQKTPNISMKDQETMGPSTYYPPWQADPHEGWALHHIPHIPPPPSMDYPQSYPPYGPSVSGVQNSGILFDPYQRQYSSHADHYTQNTAMSGVGFGYMEMPPKNVNANETGESVQSNNTLTEDRKFDKKPIVAPKSPSRSSFFSTPEPGSLYDYKGKTNDHRATEQSMPNEWDWNSGSEKLPLTDYRSQFSSATSQSSESKGKTASTHLPIKTGDPKDNTTALTDIEIKASVPPKDSFAQSLGEGQERNLFSDETPKYHSFNHQNYFNAYYQTPSFSGIEHSPMSKYHPILAPTSAYPTNHQIPYSEHQQREDSAVQQQQATIEKNKKVYPQNAVGDGGGFGNSSAINAGILLSPSESTNHVVAQNNKNMACDKTGAMYEKSDQKCKLYQPHLNLHVDDISGSTKDKYSTQRSDPENVMGKSTRREHNGPELEMDPKSGQQRQFYVPSQNQNLSNLHMTNGYFPHYDVNGARMPEEYPTMHKETPDHPYQGSSQMNNSLDNHESNQFSHHLQEIKTEPGTYECSSEIAGNQQYPSEDVKDALKPGLLEPSSKEISTPVDRTEKSQKPEVPDCDCSVEKPASEPGSYYTHLGCASSLAEMRTDFETRFNIQGKQLRIETVLYTGKEGKTGQGCPLAKWIIRRGHPEEKVLCIVKKRQGHRCAATFLIICIVVWDGISKSDADSVYSLLIHKLTKFGLPTTRRCATNENRTCACQGLDPETSGASYSFGCSWSMYYNGCKYARSKTVRKFRLSVKSEEAEIEERMNYLASMLAPLYQMATPKAYANQCKYEREAPECRLGYHGRNPFSGVTASMDFCAHAHRDLHNMQDGCTVQVALLRNRLPNEEADEQLHILPLYVLEKSTEESETPGEKQQNKGVQTLDKFPCEVRIRSTPLQPCRRHGKKRPGKEGEEESATTQTNKKNASPKHTKGTSKSGGSSTGESTTTASKSPGASPSPSTTSAATAQNPVELGGTPRSNPPQGQGQFGGTTALEGTSATVNPNSNLVNMASMINNFTDAQLQSNQISSTVLDSPYTYDYNTGSYVDSRSNYNSQHGAALQSYHHSTTASNSAAIHQGPVRGANNIPGWGDLNNNNRGNLLANPSPVNARVESNPDSTSVASSQIAYGNAFASAAAAKPGAGTADTDFFKSRVDYGSQMHHQHSLNQGSYSMYPPPHPPYHHHHPGFGDHQAYQHGYDYRYNYSSYTSQPFHSHPYSGMYPPSSYPGWNSIYGATPTATVPSATATIHSSGHVPVSGASNTPGATFGFNSQQPSAPTTVIKSEPVVQVESIGEVQEVNDNVEAFQDAQMGGIGIALEHGSVLFECAKHEMHATSALKKPNRTHPNRIALIFYQHRNLNRPKHGTEEWEEKMRLKKSSQGEESGGAGGSGGASGVAVNPVKQEESTNEPLFSNTTPKTSFKTEMNSPSATVDHSLTTPAVAVVPPVVPQTINTGQIPMTPTWPMGYSSSAYHQHTRPGTDYLGQPQYSTSTSAVPNNQHQLMRSLGTHTNTKYVSN